MLLCEELKREELHNLNANAGRKNTKLFPIIINIDILKL